MTVSMTSLHDPDKLLNSEEGHDATEDSKSHREVMRLMLPSVSMTVSMTMAVSVTSPFLLLSHEGMRDEVKESIAKEAPTREGKEDLDQPLLLRGVVQRDEEENEERRGRDEESGPQSRHPHVGPRILILIIIPVSVKVFAVSFTLLFGGFTLGRTMSMTMTPVGMSMTSSMCMPMTTSM